MGTAPDIPFTLQMPWSLFDQLSESIAIYALDGRCLYVNPATERMTGLPRAELVGTIIWERFPQMRGNLSHEAFLRVASTGEPEEYELHSRAIDRWFWSRVYRLDGHVWVVARDITEEKRLRAFGDAGAARLQVLRSVSRALADAGLALQPVFDAVVRQVAEHIADACSVTIVREGGRLDVVAMHHRDPARGAAYRALVEGRPLRVGEGVTGRVAANGQPVLLPVVGRAALQESLVPEYRQLVDGIDAVSVLVVALRMHGRILGTLQAARLSGAHPFTAEDLTLLEEVAERAAGAIANAQLHDETRLHRQVLESMAEGVAVTDKTTRVLWVNPALERMFGLPAEKLRGQPLQMMNTVAPAQREALFSTVADALKERGSWIGEIPHVRANGEPFTARTIVSALVDDPERRFVSVRQDITEEKRVTAELDAVIAASPSAVMVLDADARVRLWNPAAERMLGYARDEVMGRPLPGILPERREPFRANLAAVCSGITIPPLETGLLARDGTIVDVGVGAAPVPHGAGYHCVLVITDISARKRAERLLRHSEELSRAAADVTALMAPLRTPAEVYAALASFMVPRIADACTIVESATDGSTRITAAIPPRGPVLDEESRERMLRGGEPVLESPVRMLLPLSARGQTFAVMALANAQGRTFDAHALQLATEVARRGAFSVDNARLHQEAHAAIKKRDEFLSVASHELKTPLTSLYLQVQSLVRTLERADGPSTEQLAGRAQKIFVQSRRISALVDELLDASRITTEQLTVVPSTADLASLVREVAGRFEDAAAYAGCELRCTVPDSLTFAFDRARVDQVLTNLVANAIKYAPGAPVELEVSASEHDARIIVRDHGAGIAPVDRERIFDQFERAVQRNGVVGGLGLGLWIARKIVAAHGGTIDVESVPGDGATFTVRLPR